MQISRFRKIPVPLLKLFSDLLETIKTLQHFDATGGHCGQQYYAILHYVASCVIRGGHNSIQEMLRLCLAENQS